MEDTQNNSSISSSDEFNRGACTPQLSEKGENYSDNLPTSSKAKRIKKNDPTRWDFAWGPPV